MVVLLILVILWIVILTPLALRRFAERSSGGSIESFHEHLHLLERTGPKLVAPAYRLESAPPEPVLVGAAPTAPALGASGYPVVSSMPRRANLVLLRPLDESTEGTLDDDDVVDDGAGGHYQRIVPDPPPAAPPTRREPDPRRRRLARQRRQTTLFALVAVVVLTGLGGLALRPLWVLTVLATLLLAAYIALVVYAQNLMIEQRRARLDGLVAAPPVDERDHGGAVRLVAGGEDEDLDEEDDPYRSNQRVASAR